MDEGIQPLAVGRHHEGRGTHREQPRPIFMPFFTQVRGETVWKFGMGPERGLRKRPGWVEGVPIGRLLPPKKCSPDTFGYFPNSFGRGFLGSTYSSGPTRKRADLQGLGIALRRYRASSTSFSVLRSFPSWRSAARF